jgi:chromosome segregation ATPase
MNSFTLSRFAGRTLAVFGCLVAAAAFAAEGASPTDDIATLKAKLSRADEELGIVLRSYTLTTQENEKLKAQISQIRGASDETAAVKARVQELQTSLDKAQKEAAAARDAATARDADNARLREILRQTQDSNAALASENARLKTKAGVATPSPAGSYAPAGNPAP